MDHLFVPNMPSPNSKHISEFILSPVAPAPSDTALHKKRKVNSISSLDGSCESYSVRRKCSKRECERILFDSPSAAGVDTPNRSLSSSSSTTINSPQIRASMVFTPFGRNKENLLCFKEINRRLNQGRHQK